MRKKVLYHWTKKIHTWAGLLTFSAFVVWGVTGVHGAFTPPPGEYTPPPVAALRELPFQAQGDADDQEISKQIFAIAEIPLAGGRYNIHRDEDLNLAFNVFTINGTRELTYYEDRGVVEVAHRRNSVWSYLSSMHSAHTTRHQLTPLSSAWGYYNTLATWAFLFMTISGVYMWIATRPNLNWARISFGAMALFTAVMWFVIR